MKKKFLVGLAVGFFMLGVVNMVSASVLNFDSLPDEINVFSSYEEFTWDNSCHMSYTWYNTNYNNTLSPVTSNEIAFNNSGAPMSVWRSDNADFNFNGVYLTGWAYDNANFGTNTVVITGYNDGNLIATRTANLIVGSMNYFNVPMNGVDKLTFSGDGADFGKWFLMDNFTYNLSPVPEPSTMLLLGFGLIGLAGVARKKMKN